MGTGFLHVSVICLVTCLMVIHKIYTQGEHLSTFSFLWWALSIHKPDTNRFVTILATFVNMQSQWLFVHPANMNMHLTIMFAQVVNVTNIGSVSLLLSPGCPIGLTAQYPQQEVKISVFCWKTGILLGHFVAKPSDYESNILSKASNLPL